MQGTGTVSFVDKEGGFYGIHADNGARYDPGGLHEKFHEHGLRIRFSVTMKDKAGDDASTRTWGTPVEVHELEVIDDE